MADVCSHSCDIFEVILGDGKLNLLYHQTIASGMMPPETPFQLVNLTHISLPKAEPQIPWIIRRERSNISRNVLH